MQSISQDLRFTARQLLKNKSFTLTAILSLALGIGATTAVFSVVYGILLDPYPYKDAKRMVHVQLLDKDGRQMALVMNTGPEFDELKQARCVDEVFMMDGNRPATMTGSQQLPVTVQLGRVHVEPIQLYGRPAVAWSSILGSGHERWESIPGGGVELPVLEEAVWSEPRRPGQDDRGGPQGLHHHRRGRSTLHLG